MRVILVSRPHHTFTITWNCLDCSSRGEKGTNRSKARLNAGWHRYVMRQRGLIHETEIVPWPHPDLEE